MCFYDNICFENVIVSEIINFLYYLCCNKLYESSRLPLKVVILLYSDL